MAIQIYYGNRLELLLGALAERLAVPPLSALDREIIIVRSTGMERWVSLRLADRFGIWANTAFPIPDRFLDELIEETTGQKADSTFNREMIAWRLTRLIPRCLDEPVFRPLRTYLGAEASPLKLFRLARQLADRYDQYLVFRPDWVAAWESGAPGGHPGAGPDSVGNHEEWQASLWRHLLDDISADGATPLHRANVRNGFLNSLRRGTIDRRNLPHRVSVFGVPALAPFFLETFCELGNHTDVALFVLNPCRTFWADILSERQIHRLRSRAKSDPAYEQGELWEDHLEAANPLLASLGKMGRDFFGLLLDWEPREDHELFSDRIGLDKSRTRRLLARMQRSVLENQPASVHAEPLAEGDSSLQLHACHSPLREIEVLRNQLLELFQENSSLKPEDVLVMAPDIETYVPFVHAHFGGGESPIINYNLSDRGLAHTSAAVQTFQAILELPRGRFGVYEILDIIESESVRMACGLSGDDLNRIRRWIGDSRINWAVDASHRQELGLPRRGDNTWRFGLARLLLGNALPERVPWHGAAACRGAGTDDRDLLGRFVDLVEQLVAIRDDLATSRPLRDWATTLRRILDGLLAGADAVAVGRLYRFAETLADAADAADYGDSVPVEVIADMLAEETKSSHHGLGFLTGGVTFCSLQPMRSVPFRVICLLGMNTDAYPRPEHPPGFDLLADRPRPGDRSIRENDRYLFLESLISARDTLYISYVGRDVRTDEVRYPSVLVGELMDAARRLAGVRLEPVLHPLQGFSPRYFDGSGLVSFAESDFRAAQAVGTGARAYPPFIARGLRDGDEEPVLDIEGLVRFYRSPARAVLRERLGLYLDERESEVSDREPFRIHGLDAYRIQDDLLSCSLADEPWDSYLETVRATGELPHGPAGRIQLADLATDVAAFWRSHHDRLTPAEKEIIHVEGSWAGVLVRDEIELWDGELLRYRHASAKPADWLRLWFGHLLIAASGHTGESHHIASDEVVTLAPVEDPDAVLESILGVYREGMRRPLPLFEQCSPAYAEAVVQGKGRAEAVGAARRKWKGSDYGRGGEESDPYVRLCFGETDPLHDEFCELAELLWVTAFRQRTEKTQ